MSSRNKISSTRDPSGRSSSAGTARSRDSPTSSSPRRRAPKCTGAVSTSRRRRAATVLFLLRHQREGVQGRQGVRAFAAIIEACTLTNMFAVSARPSPRDSERAVWQCGATGSAGTPRITGLHHAPPRLLAQPSAPPAMTASISARAASVCITTGMGMCPTREMWAPIWREARTARRLALR